MKANMVGLYVRRAILIIILLILFMGINPFERSPAQAPYVYYGGFSSPYTLTRVDSDGTNPVTIHTPSNNSVNKIATDHVDKIYFFDNSDSGVIYKANFDGSSKSSFISGRATALAAGKGYVYYALIDATGALMRVNADGTNPVTIYTPGSGTVQTVAIDFLNNKLYFYDDEGTGTIYKSDLDGSNRNVFKTIKIKSLAVGAGYVYYSDFAAPYTLIRCDVDGSNSTTVYTSPEDYVYLVAVDPTANKIYFHDGWASDPKVYKADLDGSNKTTFLSARISALAVHGEGATSVTVNHYRGANRKYSNQFIALAGLMIAVSIGFVLSKVRRTSV